MKDHINLPVDCDWIWSKNDGWESTDEILEELKRHGATVDTLEDENGEVYCIYFQLPEQKTLNDLFGDALQLDGTYKICRCAGMCLYTIMATDNHGNGMPVAHFFLREETTESIKQGLRFFKKVKKTNQLKINNT